MNEGVPASAQLQLESIWSQFWQEAPFIARFLRTFGRGFDSHRPLHKPSKIHVDSAALTRQPSLNLRSKSGVLRPFCAQVLPIALSVGSPGEPQDENTRGASDRVP